MSIETQLDRERAAKKVAERERTIRTIFSHRDKQDIPFLLQVRDLAIRQIWKIENPGKHVPECRIEVNLLPLEEEKKLGWDDEELNRGLIQSGKQFPF